MTDGYGFFVTNSGIVTNHRGDVVSGVANGKRWFSGVTYSESELITQLVKLRDERIADGLTPPPAYPRPPEPPHNVILRDGATKLPPRRDKY